MRNRSNVTKQEEDIAKLALDELNAEVARRQTRMKIAPTTYLRKAFFKRIVQLETERERLFGLPRSKYSYRHSCAYHPLGRQQPRATSETPTVHADQRQRHPRR